MNPGIARPSAHLASFSLITGSNTLKITNSFATSVVMVLSGSGLNAEMPSDTWRPTPGDGAAEVTLRSFSK
jgi:hypothetical protein